ncbi:MAG: hypothetical protein Q4C46_05495 [Bacillota bacterium]|nr:hypothetical protein [Bacillota bacterium]
MATTILNSKKSTYGGPYAYYSVAVSINSRTPTKVSLTFKITGWLQYSSSWLGTGHEITAKVYVGGSWHSVVLKSSSSKWSGTTKHSKEMTVSVNVSPGTATLTKIKFKASNSGASACDLSETSCSNISITNISAKYNNVVLSEVSKNQAYATVKISGLPKAVGYDSMIYWYNGSTYIGATSVSKSSQYTEFPCTFYSLLPNTTYGISAYVKYGDTQLKYASLYITTPQETGYLALSPKSTYITASISGMFDYPNYTRTIEVQYKKSSESTYKTYATLSSQRTTASVNISGLTSNISYDVKVLIKMGATVLVTLTASAKTLLDTSLVPTARIDNITQKLGTRECTIEWMSDKAVSGTTYKVQAQVEGESTWATLMEIGSVSSPVLVIAPAGNKNISFRIISNNELVSSGVINYSDVFSFYVRDDFLWDSEKISGQVVVITANEWNRLRDYVIARNQAIGKAVTIPLVRSGDAITAETYNIMKNAISQVIAVDIADKVRGDAMKASDIDALRVAVNTKTT